MQTTMIALQVKHKKSEEVQLINQAKQGTESAFNELYRRYHKSLRHFGDKKLIGKIEMDADDFCQQVFAKAFLAIHSYHPTYKFSTWLFRIGSNLIIDLYRKKKLDSVAIPEGSEHEDFLTEQFKDTNRIPIEQLVKEEDFQFLHSVIKQHLTGNQQLVVTEVFFNGKKLDEVAKELDIPLNTVKGLIFRAKAILRKHITREMIRN